MGDTEYAMGGARNAKVDDRRKLEKTGAGGASKQLTNPNQTKPTQPSPNQPNKLDIFQP